MGLYNIDYSQFSVFLIILVRVGAIIIASPVLGGDQVPAQVKIGLILFITIVTYPVVHITMPAGGHNDVFELLPLLFSEMMIGLCIGFAARIIFAGVQLAGQVIGFQMGFAVVNVMDPVSNSQVSVTSQALNIFAILVFLIVDAHHLFIQGILYSFAQIEPGGFSLGGDLMETLIKLSSTLFLVGIQLSAPVVAILFFMQVGLGILARTVPQMNVFVVGLPLQILVGLLMLSLSIPVLYWIVSEKFGGLGFTIAKLITMMH